MLCSYFVLCVTVIQTVSCQYNEHTSSVLDNARTPIKTIAAFQPDTVDLRLYYESLCPDCMEFDPEFVKVAEKLNGYVQIHTYPYGNAEMINNPDGSVTVKCQHGEPECYGNMLHDCALLKLNDKLQALQYNGCMMKKYSDDKAAKTCAQELSIGDEYVEAILKCAKGPEGHQLLVEYGRESDKANFSYVPYVLINRKVWDGHNKDFMKDVCAAFTQPPESCQQ